jgi:hypothetical protein
MNPMKVRKFATTLVLVVAPVAYLVLETAPKIGH